MGDLKINTPQPLAATAERPNKDEAIEQFVTRYRQ